MTPPEQKFETHLFTYRHDGAEWLLTLKANDADDARARLGKLAYATHHGVQMACIPAALSPLGMLVVTLRNAVHALYSRFQASGAP